MTLSTVLLRATVAGAVTVAGCAETNMRGPGDAGPRTDAVSATDTERPQDAAPMADTWRGPDALGPDAFVSPDAGPAPGGCFESAATIWTSSAGPSSRAHGRVLGAIGTEDGWLAVAADPEELIALDREGSVRWRSSIELYGQPARMHVMEGSLVVFAHDRVTRMELDAAGIARTFRTEYVGGLSDRNEGTMAVAPLGTEPGVRAISIHLDSSLRYLLRVSELRPDAAAETGFVQVSARIELPTDLRLEEARAYLHDDHLWLLVRSGAWRVLDVQLGLGGLGTEPTVPTRVWTDETWAASPAHLLNVVQDPPIAITAQTDPGTAGYVGYLETLPPASPMRTALGAGLSLGYGRLGTATLDADGDLVVATDLELSVFARDGASRASVTLEGTANTDIRLARRGREVAAVFVEGDSSDRRIAIRCMALP